MSSSPVIRWRHQRLMSIVYSTQCTHTYIYIHRHTDTPTHTHTDTHIHTYTVDSCPLSTLLNVHTQTHIYRFWHSLHFNGHFPGGPGLAGTRMSPFWILLELRMMVVVSGDNWSYKTCDAPVKSSPPTNQHPQAGCPSCHPTNSVRALKERHIATPGDSRLGAIHTTQLHHSLLANTVRLHAAHSQTNTHTPVQVLVTWTGSAASLSTAMSHTATRCNYLLGVCVCVCVHVRHWHYVII